MPTVTAADGTSIAYETIGCGPPLILVDGALCSRAFGPSRKFAERLAARFTVVLYDRRGRGGSTDTEPYAVEREIEDLAAIIDDLAAAPFVFGLSSGAALALEAANARLPIAQIAAFEAPFIVDDTRAPIPRDFLARLNGAIDADRRGEAVTMFMRLVGAPGPAILMMKLLPAWRRLKAAAHTLPYDITIVQRNQRGESLCASQWERISVPAIIIGGAKSPAWMRNGVRALANAVPGASLRMLKGQTHMVQPVALAPVLVEFFLNDTGE